LVVKVTLVITISNIFNHISVTIKKVGGY